MSAAGLEPTVRRLLQDALDAGTFSAASARVVIDGAEVASVALGNLASVGDGGTALSADALEPAREDTLFDLASVTKVFSAHTLLELVEAGVLELDDPIARHLPEYRAGQRARVTLRHLLTHTSGLPAEWRGWLPEATAGGPPPAPDSAAHAELVSNLLATPLEAAPGTRWRYSDAGFNTAMILAERAASTSWHQLVERYTLRALSLRSVTFTPDPSRTAATEYQPEFSRGVVRGIVHDESSWRLGGACANAGLFADSAGLLAFAEAIRAGEGWVRGEAMWQDQLPGILGADAMPDHGASLGLRIGELSWMGDRGGTSRGHTGFTGTSLQIDRDAGVSIVLLTNRVHPTRNGPSVHPLRAALADAALAAAAAGRASEGLDRSR